MTHPAALAALLLASAGCIPEEGPMMKPGSDCLECHGGGEGRRWTVAGTVGGSTGVPMGGTRGTLGQQIGIVDAAGKSFSLRVNKAGNFWSAEPVTFPLQVGIDGVPMPAPVTAADASCNRCHGNGPGSGGDGGD